MTVTVRPTCFTEIEGLISSKLDANVSEEWRKILLTSSYNSSMMWLGTDDDKVLCFYGLISPTILSDEAYLWMHTTEALKEHTFVLIRHSQRAIKEMLRHYAVIVGHGKQGNDRSLAWLRMLGAKFLPPANGLIPFEIRSN